MDQVYIHDDIHNNLRDPRHMLSTLFPHLNPRSVIDIGCGTGTFLAAAKELGVERVTGFDGSWVDRQMLHRHLDPGEFVVADLRRPLPEPVPTADLTLCLEVAEHIDAPYADVLVTTLVATSDLILFSAAPPGQGGQRHINEQWPDYWEARFAQHGYSFHDVVRPLIWNDDRISHWYRQNTFLVVSPRCTDVANRFPRSWNPDGETPLRLVHPDLFAEKIRSHRENQDRIFTGGLRPRAYLFLTGKAVYRRVRETLRRA